MTETRGHFSRRVNRALDDPKLQQALIHAMTGLRGRRNTAFESFDFTIQYATAFVVPLVAGALWDATGQAALAFVPGVAAGVAMAWGAMSLRIPLRGEVPPAAPGPA